jgi:hypothetical protein
VISYYMLVPVVLRSDYIPDPSSSKAPGVNSIELTRLLVAILSLEERCHNL